MDAARRLFVTSSLAAALAACGRHGPLPTPPIDVKLLDRKFPDLADRARPGELDAGFMSLETAQTWYWNAEKRFPMQSVFKAPLGAAVLAEVDAGRVKLAETIRLTEADLSPGHSPIAQAWPTPPDRHAQDFTVIGLLTGAVRDSDNTAADAIMKRIGGPGALTAWLRSKAILEMRVDRYERELQQEVAGMASFRPAWKDPAAWLAARTSVPPALRQTAMDAYLADPRDTTTVQDALNFLFKLARGQLVSPASMALLLKLMTDTARAPNRLRAGLPKGAVIAHKAGSSGTDLGFTPATNDIGIVTLKDGRRYAIAAFLAGSTATEAQRDATIADTARLMLEAAG
jgi:beta-lactamase class A